MTKKILWAALALVVSFASCKKDDPTEVANSISREFAPSYSDEATTIRLGKSITITVTGTQATTDPSGITWALNGKEVARGISYTFQPSEIGHYTLVISSADRSISITREYTVEPRGLSLSYSNEATTIQQIEPITITATGDLVTADPTGIVWTLNGKEVSRGEAYFFRPSLPGRYTLTVSSSKYKDISVTREYTVEPRFTKGAFLLNEGNMTNETGTITYVDIDKKAILDSAYIHVNGTKLGNVCQDLAFANDKVYIISQNGPQNGGEGLLTIAKAGTLEKIKVFNDAALAKLWPTHIAVIDDRIYLRTDKNGGGIYLGTENGGFKLIEGTTGAKKLRMAVIGQRVFAITSSKKLLMIQGDKVVKELPLAGSPSGLALADDGNLWVSYVAPNTIAKVNPDPADFKIIASNALTESTSVGWGATSAIFATGNTIYFSGATTTIRKHDFAKKTTAVFANILDAKYAPELKIHYNSLGVDPKTGYVYYSGIKGFGMDYKINSTLVLDPQGNVLIKKDKTNSFPAGWYFIPKK
ncbi:DUF5074 domain-containing protein [uncultured Porphyromonas sp.]|uniref:DUF5074 domain-containing protein n=1 Tax=uncultured Porphyromonas sp. TaxID=159274 RepID=UPI002638A035|nr:DUF5074 domain-containing protein [uncultured Porphyromonas sp.]